MNNYQENNWELQPATKKDVAEVKEELVTQIDNLENKVDKYREDVDKYREDVERYYRATMSKFDNLGETIIPPAGDHP